MVFSMEIDCIALELQAREAYDSNKLSVELLRIGDEVDQRDVERLGKRRTSVDQQPDESRTPLHDAQRGR